VSSAKSIEVGGLMIRFASVADLLVLMLAAAEKPRRRRSKRRQDLLDIIALAEEHPEQALSVPKLKQRVGKLAAAVLTVGD
jgi:hypothetical protein